jgi:hypothetical protein
MRTIITSLFFMLMLTLSTSAQTSEDVNSSVPKNDITVIDFFTVTCDEKLWDIKWKALSEIESCTYSVEYSYDQQTWLTFKNINGTAHTLGDYNYNTTMKRTSDSLCSFRLKYDCTPSLEYYKNPVANICPEYIPESISTTFIIEYNNDAIQIGGKLNNNVPSKIAVYSILGQLMYQTEVISVNSKLNIPYQLSDNEIVIVKISNGNNVFSKKIYIP